MRGQEWLRWWRCGIISSNWKPGKKLYQDDLASLPLSLPWLCGHNMAVAILNIDLPTTPLREGREERGLFPYLTILIGGHRLSRSLQQMIFSISLWRIGTDDHSQLYGGLLSKYKSATGEWNDYGCHHCDLNNGGSHHQGGRRNNQWANGLGLGFSSFHSYPHFWEADGSLPSHHSPELTFHCCPKSPWEGCFVVNKNS